MSETRAAYVMDGYSPLLCPWCRKTLTVANSAAKGSQVYCKGCESRLTIARWRRSGGYRLVELSRETDGSQVAYMEGAGEIGRLND